MARVTLEGFVLTPDGAPAEGAVVVSSVRGRASTDAAGNYRLEVEVPFEAARVQVTAAGRPGENLPASASVAVNTATRSTRVNPLVLPLRASCSPSWVPTFGREPGTDRDVSAVAVHDDGTGPALYVGGGFASAGGVRANRIAKWDGSRWSALGSGMSPNTLATEVRALATYDDGGGPALYAGGSFTSAGGVPANHIAKWDGSSWTALGSGTDGHVFALAVYDDGNGPALYAGGSFTLAGGFGANYIAKWDGESWAPVFSGTDGEVHALAVFDDGGGPALYAGGAFWSAGFVSARRVAKWNGSSWAALGNGMRDSEDVVLALAGFDDGSGPALYAGGEFWRAGGVVASGIAKWDGSSWAALGAPEDHQGVSALAVHDDGTETALYAAGNFDLVHGVPANGIARWNGSTWSPLGSGTNGGVRALTEYDDGNGPALHAGGSFRSAGSVAASRIAKWDDSTWSALGSRGMNGAVGALAVHDDGSGPALHAAVDFMPGFLHGDQVAKWDGASWVALGSGMGGGYPYVRALVGHDDGSGPALYAGGSFTSAGGVAATGIARWDGSSWAALGSGMNAGSTVHTLTVHVGGAGPALFAGGSFTTAGGVVANRIARWKDSSWAALGSGTNGSVHALATHDDGAGRALYAGGEFIRAGGVVTNRIAKWNGSSWSALGSGIGGTSVLALAAYDDGAGPALYAAGTFTTAGGVPATNIAKWDGASWSVLGGGTNDSVHALAVHDDGDGPALYAGGNFTTAGGVVANRIARWDGSTWAALGSGMSGTYPWVDELVSYDDGPRPVLVAGGRFSCALDSGDSYVAMWGCTYVPPVLSCPSAIAVRDRPSNGPGEVVTFVVTAAGDLDRPPVVVCSPQSGSLFPTGTTLVQCTATDAWGNQSSCRFPVSVTPKVRRR